MCQDRVFPRWTERPASPRRKQSRQFPRLRLPSGLRFGIKEFPVRLNVEDSPAALDEGRFRSGGLFDLCRRTGGKREIVSLDAVFDRDAHGCGD